MALETGLTNVWLLQANSNDSVGSNNGTDTAISYASPVAGYANFNGSTSKVALGTAIAHPAAVSLMVWVMWTSGANSMVFCDSDAGASNAWYLRIDSDGKVRFSWTNSSGNNQQFGTTSVVIADGNLHCILVTQATSTSTPIIYIDSVSKAVSSLSNSGSTLPAAQGTHFGDFGLLGTQQYTGAMALLCLWNVVKTGAEATTLYNGGVLPGFSGGVFTFVTTVISPLATLNIQGLVPTLKVFVTSPLANINIQGLIPTIRIFGWISKIKNLTSWTDKSKQSTSWTDKSKHSTNWIDKTKN